MTRGTAVKRASDSIESGLMAKFVAGVAGGFGLGIAASALLAWLSPGGLTAASKFQVAMWLVPPVWIAVASATFLFRSGTRAFTWLVVANAVAFAMVALCQRAVS
jgi:hypothetical protein